MRWLARPGPEDLARAASRWVRQVAASNMAGRGSGTFKVCPWGPKVDDALLHSARFVAPGGVPGLVRLQAARPRGAAGDPAGGAGAAGAPHT